MRQESLYELERIASKVHRAQVAGADDCADIVAALFISHLRSTVAPDPSSVTKKALRSQFDTWAFFVEINLNQTEAVWKSVLGVVYGQDS